MKFLPVLVVTMMPLAAGPAGAGETDAGGDAAVGWAAGARARFVAPELVLISSLDARAELLEAGAGGHEPGADDHDPALMLMASLAVPGAGQLIQGNTRGYLFLAAEVAFWGGFYLLESRGMDERDEYETFADDHWDFAAYAAWYDATCVDCPDCDEYLCRPLADYGTQEYYEDIGKYATYWRWWTIDGDETYIDWREYSTIDEAFRDSYYDMRGDSNRHLKQARYAMTAAFLNHVVAAVDAFLTARSGGSQYSDSGSDLGIEFDVADGGDGLRCALTVRY
ncbi:MAG: hypothetical protein ABIE42_09345 [Candidatus Eisenbacteria bacterium]